jgi:hypothetical protein
VPPEPIQKNRTAPTTAIPTASFVVSSWDEVSALVASILLRAGESAARALFFEPPERVRFERDPDTSVEGAFVFLGRECVEAPLSGLF